jgi:putative hemolysin
MHEATTDGTAVDATTDPAEWSEERGDYAIRLARGAEDRRRVQALRFGVFSRELGARVEGAERGLDIDPLDERADHLMVEERASGACVGSYRLVTQEQVTPGPGFYTERLFDLASIDPAIRRDGVELGRACIELRHRNRGVFQLLLRGIGAHLLRTDKRYLFGCGSVPLKEPGQARRAIEDVTREGWIDPALAVSPTLAHRVPTKAAPSGARPELPALLYAYCAIGARLSGAPAWDADFRTLDFFVLLDLERVEPRTYARYCLPR